MKETAAGERRVALVPETARRLAGLGVELLVQAGAGMAASFPDEAYAQAECRLVPDAGSLCREADVVCKVVKPSTEEVSGLREGSVLIATLSPLADVELAQALAEQGVTAFALDSMPRITRAQPMDVLSSQSTVAGYKAALLAGTALGRFFPMLTTAAGTIPPAKVLVLGAGVAGLQAIATARRLGAVVSAFDVRAAVKEQVESLGATFVVLEVEHAEGAGGYAAELSDEQHRREQEQLARVIAENDAVITTALIPGRPAPKLVTAEAVRQMRPGSVIVDLAAEAGGNCELTVPGETVERHGVTILGPLNLPSSLATHASQMFSRNLLSFLTHLLQDGELVIDLADEITSGTCVTRDGHVLKKL